MTLDNDECRPQLVTPSTSIMDGISLESIALHWNYENISVQIVAARDWFSGTKLYTVIREIVVDRREIFNWRKCCECWQLWRLSHFCQSLRVRCARLYQVIPLTSVQKPMLCAWMIGRIICIGSFRYFMFGLYICLFVLVTQWSLLNLEPVLYSNDADLGHSH